jgi:regulator of nonsense transcripts 1
MSGMGMQGKNKTYTGYASSVVSQQLPTESDAVSQAGSMAGGRVTYNQFDRLPGEPPMPGHGLGGRRRLSIGSVAPSDAPTASMYAYGYKAGDDDAQSIAPSQAGMTEY